MSPVEADIRVVPLQEEDVENEDASLIAPTLTNSSLDAYLSVAHPSRSHGWMCLFVCFITSALFAVTIFATPSFFLSAVENGASNRFNMAHLTILKEASGLLSYISLPFQSTQRLPLLVTDVAPLDDVVDKLAPTNRTVCVPTSRGRLGNQVYAVATGMSTALHLNLSLTLYASDYLLYFPAWRNFSGNCPRYDSKEIELWYGTPTFPSWIYSEAATNSTFHLVLQGHLQSCTSFFKPYRSTIRSLLTIDRKYNDLLQLTKELVMTPVCARSLIVAIHIRRGDFPDPWHGSVPVDYYIRLLHRLQSNESNLLHRAKLMQYGICDSDEEFSFEPTRLVVLLISDDSEGVSKEFEDAHFHVIRSSHVYAYASELFRGQKKQSDNVNLGVLVDYWLLGQFFVSAFSHSTFSFTAALLSPYSENGVGLFYRPDPVGRSMISFDPWNYCISLETRGAFAQGI